MIKKLIPVKTKDNIKNKITQFSKKWLDQNKAKVFHCNLCNSKHSGFLPYVFYGNFLKGWKYSPEEAETFNVHSYFCPVCESCDRDRLYKAFLEKEFEKVDQNGAFSFIEFAPSKLLSDWVKSKSFINYKSADLYLEGVDDKVDIQNMSIYDDSTFDYILCSHVLEHVENDILATKELFRILKPGGIAILMVPILTSIKETHEDKTIETDELRWKHYGQGDHLRLYSKDGFLSVLKGAGFLVTQLKPKHIFGEESYKQSYFNGISINSVLYIATKK